MAAHHSSLSLRDLVAVGLCSAIFFFFFLIRLFYQTKNKFPLVSIFCLDHIPRHVLKYIEIFHKSE